MTMSRSERVGTSLALTTLIGLIAVPALGQTVPSEQEAPAPTPTVAPGTAATSAPEPPRDTTAPASVSAQPETRERPQAPTGSMDLTPPPQPEEPCRETDKDAPEGFGQFLLGIGFLDLTDLRDRLVANGYGQLASTVTMIGGEGHAVFDSGFIIGARGAALMTPEASRPDGVSARVSGGLGMVDLGFALVHTRPFLLSLAAGVGGYGYGVDLGDGASASFDDALANPARSTSISTGGVLGSLTVGFDGRVDVGPVEEGQRGFFTLGVRLGVLYGPPIGDWSLSNGGNATGGPSTSLAGGYAAMAIGFGGRRVDRENPFE